MQFLLHNKKHNCEITKKKEMEKKKKKKKKKKMTAGRVGLKINFISFFFIYSLQFNLIFKKKAQKENHRDHRKVPFSPKNMKKEKKKCVALAVISKRLLF